MAPRGRPRGFDRDAALEAAMLLFWRKGFSATSMAELCAAMGINAPSLYAAFGSKEDLYEAALEHYVHLASPPIWTGLDAAPTAFGAVESVLMGSVKSLPGENRPGGCMVTLSNVGEECKSRLGALVAAARSESQSRLAGRFARAVAEGELPAGLDVEALARFYVCLQQGMSIQARDGADSATLEAIARAGLKAWPVLTSGEETAPAPPAPPAR